MSFVFFILEMVCLSIARKAYRMSFFFCMDMLGTLSILLDITMIARQIQKLGNITDGSVLRAARVAKIGAKSGRLAKLVRLFRLLFKEKKDEGEVGISTRMLGSLVLSLSHLLLYSTLLYSTQLFSGPTEKGGTGIHGLGATLTITCATRCRARDDHHRVHALAYLDADRHVALLFRGNV